MLARAPAQHAWQRLPAPRAPRAAHDIPARQWRGRMACSQALLPLFAGRLRRLPAPDAMAVGLLVLAAAFPAAWHLWAERRAGNANHLFAVALAFGFWQARAALLVGLTAEATPGTMRSGPWQARIRVRYPTQNLLWQAREYGAGAQVLMLVQLVSTARELEAMGGQGAARSAKDESR